MPNSPSAEKRLRQTEARTLRNKVLRSSMRTWRKKVLEAVAAGKKAEAQGMLPELYRQLDKCAKKRILHPNNAANQKRQIAKKVSALA